jgi:hypothetical protein
VFSGKGKIMKNKISRIIEIPCPLIQALEMIEMIAENRYRANRHHWTEPQDVVIKNLKRVSELRMRMYGYAIIVEDFFDFFIPEEA